MSKHFCILCVSLSMLGFFTLKSLNASDDKDSLPVRKHTFQTWWGVSIFEQSPLPPVHDLLRRTHAKIDEFYTKKITEFLGHRPDNKQNMNVFWKTFNAVFRLSGMHKDKIEEQNKREANSAEIIAIFKKVDTELRTRIDKGDFELDLTEDLKKEGYAMVDGSLTKLK